MSTLPFLLYPPSIGEPPYPLVIFLHGSGERGDDLLPVKKHGLPQYLEHGGTLPAYSLIPQCPLGKPWESVLDELDVLLDQTLLDSAIDSTRIYLTGFSMGAYGTWRWALRHPTKFAAILPVGGSGYRISTTLEEHPWDFGLLAHLPIWMIHSAADTAVPVRGADEFARRLIDIGAIFGYTRYPDADHGETCRRAFFDQTHYDWLFAQVKK